MIKYAVFILTFGRPDRVKTIQALRNHGYSGDIHLVVSDDDQSLETYKSLHQNVHVFNKEEIAKTFDEGDNFQDKRAVVYARNYCFKLAEALGYKYFIQLDDDYSNFQYRFGDDFSYKYKSIKSLENVFQHLFEFLERSKANAIAMAQGGDFIGGADGTMSKAVTLKRKCMNSFFCSTERPFKFVGRINEDTTTYVSEGSKGGLFFTANQVCLVQTITQSNGNGLTDIYLSLGTYVKSFYSVMYHPSSVKVKAMNYSNPRLHHSVSWKNTVPMILREDLKKK